MKTHIRPFAVIALFAAIGATGATTSVTVNPSNISFRQAWEACQSESLAGISLTLGHVRVAEGPGVQSDIDVQSAGAQTITLSSGSKSATAVVNALKNTVSAKHVTLASRGRVACIAPD
ncbi:MAG: hypothetical protein WCB01_01855 [Candidatus Cybelea sp.]